MIFLRCVGAILLLSCLACGLVAMWDQHHNRRMDPGYPILWGFVLLLCVTGLGMLFLRKSAALVSVSGLTLFSVWILAGPVMGKVDSVGTIFSLMFVIPLLCASGGILYCWRELKGW